MAYDFTVLQSAEAGIAAKRVTRARDGTLTWRLYDNVTSWWVRPWTSANNEEMADVLRALSPEADVMIVAGAPIPGLDLSKPQLRRSNNPDPSTNTLMNVQRSWIPLDLDDVTVPRPLGNADQLPKAAQFIRDTMLPDEFHGIEMVVTATSNTGFKGPGTARLRMFCQLNREHALEGLHGWSKAAKIVGVPIDPSVLQPHQPIYTARPLFDGLHDPVAAELRAFILAGPAGDRVHLQIDRFAARAATVMRELRYARSQKTDRRRDTAAGGDARLRALSDNDWRAQLEQTLGGPEGFFEPLKRGIGMAVRSGASTYDIFVFVDNLLEARADDRRRAHYDEQWLDTIIASFRDRDAVADSEIARLKNNLIRR